MYLFHTGFQEIREPDVHFGRKNADFGQGFYLTADEAFARRWAKERKDQAVILNRYELRTEGLRIYRFTRSEEWFQYIFANRSGSESVGTSPDSHGNESADTSPDSESQKALREADVVIGPIANDTLYDTFGIITSGFLTPAEAMRLLMIGSEYEQIALKTENAARQLTWLGAEVIPEAEVKSIRAVVAEEEAAYQKLFAEEMMRMDEGK